MYSKVPTLRKRQGDTPTRDLPLATFLRGGDCDPRFGADVSFKDAILCRTTLARRRSADTIVQTQFNLLQRLQFINVGAKYSAQTIVIQGQVHDVALTTCVRKQTDRDENTSASQSKIGAALESTI
jgi:hypothetical protein